MLSSQPRLDWRILTVALCFTGTLMSACGGSPAPTKAPASVAVVTPAPENGAGAEPEAPSRARQSCSFDGQNLSYTFAAAAFASAPRATASFERLVVQFPGGDVEHRSSVRGNVRSIALRGYLPNRPPLYLSAPHAFGGWLSPSGIVTLKPLRGHKSNLEVELEPLEGLALGEPLAGRVPCPSLSLTGHSVAMVEAFPQRPLDYPGPMLLRAGRIELRTSEEGEPAAHLDNDTLARVEVWRRGASRSQVLYSGSEFTALVWVDNSVLEADPNTSDYDAGEGFGAGGLGLRGIGSSGRISVRICQSPTELLLVNREGAFPIGTVADEPLMRESGHEQLADQGLVAVTLYRSGLSAIEPAALAMQRDAFESCAQDYR